MSNRNQNWMTFVLPVVTLFVVILIWHFTVVFGNYQKFLLPAPGDVAQIFIEKPSTLFQVTIRTGLAALGGFVSAVFLGVFISLLFSQSRWIRQCGYPYAIFFQTVPIVAIAPLIINLFGYGLPSIIVVATMISLFPIITNTTTGLISVDPDLLELFHLNRATRWQILWKLRVPSSMRYLMTGMKTSCGLAVVGAIVGEFFAGVGVEQYGLGYYIRMTGEQLKTAELFAAMICSTLLGIVVFVLISLVQQYLLKRWMH